MRVSAALALLAGCNWVYGLDATKERDASPTDDAGDAPPPRVRLTYKVATTAATGSPSPGTVSLVAITPPPVVRFGKLDGALVDGTYLDDGEIEIRDVFKSTWRFEYTPPGDVPHEVQWHPAPGAGHLTVPVFGRLARSPAPTGSRYSISTPPTFHVWTAPAASTTGIWSQTPVLGASNDPLVIDATMFKSLAGATAAADGGQNDHVVVGEFMTSPQCPRYMIGAATMMASTLTGATTFIAGAYNGAATPIPITLAKTPSNKLAMALGARNSASQTGTAVVVGRMPSVDMPAFTSTYNGAPAPVQIVLSECTPGFSVAVSEAVPDLPAAGTVYVSNVRQVDTCALQSSITSVDARIKPTTPLEPTYQVPLALTAKLTDATTTYDLDLADQQPFNIPTSRLELSFTHDPVIGDMVFDYFEVELYSVNRALPQPTPIRVYVVADVSTPKVTIDPAVFKPGLEYVFAIRTFRGTPSAKNHDFTVHTFPQAMGHVFFRTFIAQ